MNSTTRTPTGWPGNLDLARILLAHDSFIDGHTGLDHREYCGEKAPSEPGTLSIDLNEEIVDALLATRGWRRRLGRYTAPDGNSEHSERDEALRLALTAEALSPTDIDDWI